jgi:uncharacterized membrane protein
MSRIQIPLDLLTSRLNIGDRMASLRSESLMTRFSNLRPVSDFFDFRRMSKPVNFMEAQGRINFNLSHFGSNYGLIFALLSIYALVTNKTLLFVIFLVVAGMWGIGKLNGNDLVFGETRFSTSQLYTTLMVVTLVLTFFASPFSTLLWLIGASGLTILGHASFMEKPIDAAFSGEAV